MVVGILEYESAIKLKEFCFGTHHGESVKITASMNQPYDNLMQNHKMFDFAHSSFI